MPNPLDDPFGAPQDDEFAIDLTGQYGNNRYIAPGMHLAQLTEVEKGTSRAGNDMWTWTFTVARGDYAGQTAKIWTALTAAAMFKLIEVVEALDLGSANAPLRFRKADALGRYAVIEIKDDEYEGKKTSTLDRVHSTTAFPEMATDLAPAGIS